jgi:hypothetical protein
MKTALDANLNTSLVGFQAIHFVMFADYSSWFGLGCGSGEETLAYLD